MFILRYRDPARYGRHLDRTEPRGHREEQPLKLGDALAWVEQDARRDAAGRPRQVVSDLRRFEEQEEREEEEEAGGACRPPDRANLFRWGQPPREPLDEDEEESEDEALPPDMASTSSTSTAPRNRAARRRAASRARKR
jgi:hypothetical protein